MRDELDETQRKLLDRGMCPDCGYRGFVLGPHGGLNQNIECANLGCRARFNVALFSGAVINGQRIERRSEGGHAWPSEPMQ